METKTDTPTTPTTEKVARTPFGKKLLEAIWKQSLYKRSPYVICGTMLTRIFHKKGQTSSKSLIE